MGTPPTPTLGGLRLCDGRLDSGQHTAGFGLTDALDRWRGVDRLDDRRDDLHRRSDGHRQDRRSLQVGDGALAFDMTLDSGRTHSAKPV